MSIGLLSVKCYTPGSRRQALQFRKRYQ